MLHVRTCINIRTVEYVSLYLYVLNLLHAHAACMWYMMITIVYGNVRAYAYVYDTVYLRAWPCASL